MMFQSQKQGAISVISGKDPITGPHLVELSEVFEACRTESLSRVVLNMADIPLVDSAGLEWLLGAEETCAASSGHLQIAAANLLCRDILRITGVGNRFEMFEDVRSAVRSYSR